MTRTPPDLGPTRTARSNDTTLAVVATVLAGLTYLAWRASGAGMLVHAGTQTQHVGLVSALVTAAVVSVVGLGLLRVLERRSAHGLRTWTVVASLVWVVSLLGPMGAVDLTSGLALASLHLVVGGVLVLGARLTRRRGVA